MLGAGMFFIIKEAVPDTNPIIFVNNFIIIWILFDLLLRFFMQQLPVMNVKPLMVLPIKTKHDYSLFAWENDPFIFQFHTHIYLFAIQYCIIVPWLSSY